MTHKYIMDYCRDKQTYKAVMFACKIRKEGKSALDAARIASNYYDVSMKDVLHFMGQRGARKQEMYK